MKLFGGMFGKKKEEEAPQNSNVGVKESINNLQNLLDTLDKKERHLQKKIADELAAVKAKTLAKDKKGALFHLKMKKKLEADVEKTMNQKHNVYSQIDTLQSATLTMEIFRSNQQVVGALKKTQQGLTVDKVEELNDEMQDTVEIHNEIQNAISQPFGQEEMYDDDELLAELEELEQEENLKEEEIRMKKLLDVGDSATKKKAGTKLPDLPSYTPPVAQAATADEEEELRQLEASMM